MRRLVLFLAGALASSALVLGVGVSPAAAITSTDYESQVLRQSSAERTAKKLTTLRHSSCLDSYAEKWAAEIAQRKKLVHRSSASLRTILDKCRLRAVGENLAQGYPSGTATVTAWMGSSGHRANILRSSHRLHGVGARQSGGRWWVVQMVGTPR